MRISDPLIIGAGPAGCAAAIRLGQQGTRALLLDRDEIVGDPLCGGFLSWRTAEQLEALDIDVAELGAHRVTRLRLFDHDRDACVDLPHPAWGLSRHCLDNALRKHAADLGAQLAFDTIRSLDGTTARGHQQDWSAETLFLASGKHDIRGSARLRQHADTALGLRIRLPASTARKMLLSSTIELHLFNGGYAGIVLQEGGSANICLALRKSALAATDGSPQSLFAWLADRSESFAARLGEDWRSARIDSIGAVPYGFIARRTKDGIYRLGDQAAVIPSLAGEGISIALASGSLAADCFLGGLNSHEYQALFAKSARKPIRLASSAWHMAETGLGARAGIALARIAPSLIAGFADWARIQAPTSLAPR